MATSPACALRQVSVQMLGQILTDHDIATILTDHVYKFFTRGTATLPS